jgi:hypothetical protein
MVSLPTPLRAALGLAVTVVDEARRLPDRAIELPMVAVSTALQMSLRAQQRYAALTARGDALLSGRQVGDEPPEWARFDDDAAAPGALDDDVELAAAVVDLVDDIDAGTGTSTLSVVSDPAYDAAGSVEPAPYADEAPAPGLFGSDAAQPVADGLGETDDAFGAAESETAEDEAANLQMRSRKTVRAPRNGRPSPFDVVSDE